MAANRGIVISNPVGRTPDGGLQMSTALDPQGLRFALLFWDIVDFPVNNIIHIRDTPEVMYLKEAGVMQRTAVRLADGINGGDPNVYAAMHTSVFRELDRREPGAWTMAIGEGGFSFRDDEVESGRGALLKFFQAIPIPDRSVPLQDILEFKSRRQDELMALRFHLEAVYQRVVSAGDGELAWLTELDALQLAIKNELACLKELGWKLRWTSFEAGLNLSAGAFAAGLALSEGLPTVGAIGAGAAASVVLAGGVALRSRPASATPFRYVTSFHREVF